MLLACQRELLHLGLSTCRSVRLLREDLCHWEAEYFFLRLEVVISKFDGNTIV
jgi:hypothetical protein